MPQTLSVIKADVGGYVGHSAMHEDVMDAGREATTRAVQSGLLIDAHVSSCGDDMFLIMSHDRGENDEAIHKLAWDAFVAGTEAAPLLATHGVVTAGVEASVRQQILVAAKWFGPAQPQAGRPALALAIRQL